MKQFTILFLFVVTACKPLYIVTEVEFRYISEARRHYESFFVLLTEYTQKNGERCTRFKKSRGFECNVQNNGLARVLVRQPTQNKVSVRMTFSLPYKEATSISEFKQGKVNSELMKSVEAMTFQHFKGAKLNFAHRKIRGSEEIVDIKHLTLFE